MPAGRDIAQLEPFVWFSPHVGTQVLPAPDLPYHSLDMPTGFTRIPYTANGVNYTFVNPQGDIATDEVGTAFTVPTGGHQLNCTYQARTPTLDMIQRYCGLRKTQLSGRAHVQTFTVTTGAAALGTVTVTLNGENFPVTLTGTVPLTTDAVATQLRAATYAGWTTGGTGSSVVFTATAVGRRGGTYAYAAGGTGSAATNAVTAIGRAVLDNFRQDPAVKNEFILVVDGHFPANSLRDQAGNCRMVIYNLQQTENPQIAFRTLGTDAVVQPTTTARAQTSTISAAQLAGTGLSLSEVHPDGVHDWWFFD